MARLDELLGYLKDNDCSDLHLAAGLEPRVRQKGGLRLMEGREVLSDEDLRAMMQEIALPKHWEEYCTTNDLDFAYGIEGVARTDLNLVVVEASKAEAAAHEAMLEKLRESGDCVWDRLAKP